MTAPARGRASADQGYVHQLGLYSSDQGLVDLVVPFLGGGLAAEEPTFVVLEDEPLRLVKDVIGEPPGLAYVDRKAEDTNPAIAIKTYRSLFENLVGGGAARIRVVGDVPHPGTGHRWDWWARYEAAVNEIFAPYPVFAMCPYDTRITAPEVLSTLHRTHPFIANDEGPGLNPVYEEPEEFLRSTALPGRDEIEEEHPLFEASLSTPSDARDLIRRAGEQAGLSGARVEDMMLAVSEAATNSLLHGRPPVHLRVWAGHHKLVVAVSDAGEGPARPLVGLLPPAAGALDGRGLWLAHQLCDHVGYDTTPEGFTVRLIVADSPATA